MNILKMRTMRALLAAAAACSACLTCLHFWSVQVGQQRRLHTAKAERHSVAYVKVFKTASDGLAAMFRRFGLQRNLSFAMPLPNRTYLAWPLPLSSRRFILLPPGVQHPNLLVDHCIYNRTFFQELMAQPCAFVTSLREPLTQVQSLFAYYNIANISGLSRRRDAFAAYMLNVTKLEASLEETFVQSCIPATRNIMSRVLGFREGVDNPQEFAHRIVSEFDLIVITERFQESMVLLKRLMRWSLKDILYEQQNARPHPVLTRSTAPQVAAAHRQWSPVDYLLYDAAAAALQRRVGEQDETFKEEVEEYRRVLGDVGQHCRRRRRGERVGDLTVRSSRWTRRFSVSWADCRSLRQLNTEKLQRLSRRLYRGDANNLQIPVC